MSQIELLDHPLFKDPYLEAYYPLEGDANDISGNSRNGTSLSLLFGTSYGKFRQGAITNGNPCGISIPVTVAGTIGTGDFAVSFWLNPKAPVATHYPMIFGSFYNSGVYAGPTIFFDPLNVNGGGNSIVFRLRNDSQQFVTTPSASSLYDTWTHIVFTRISGVCYVYYNGSLVKQFSDSYNIPVSQAAYLLSRTDNTNQSFNSGANAAKGDDFAYWSRGLTAAEALSLYDFQVVNS